MRESYSYSPEPRSMNNDSNSFRNSGTYTSPGTPEYADNHGNGFPKGWYSERIPLPNNNTRRRVSANIVLPFNNGRTPSKWDDAERWITSPVSKSLAPPPQRKPKSKSGPLGPTSGPTNFSNYSPGFQFVESGNTHTKNVFAGSPFSTGVLVPNGYSFHINGEKIDENNVSGVVSRRDMATQMSPEDSPDSCPMGQLPLSTSPPLRVEVRDVQVDKRVTMTKQSKRQSRRMENRSTEVNDMALTWSPKEGVMDLSKHQKEEARIDAWENLQNAKAEASIRKLEMKLEKKKSASMEKIMKRLTIAQMKANEMRKKMSGGDESQSPKTLRKVMLLQRNPKSFLTSCFCVH